VKGVVLEKEEVINHISHIAESFTLLSLGYLMGLFEEGESLIMGNRQVQMEIL